jgi:hypothetical protein
MGVAVGVLTELGVAGPVPFVFNAPALPDHAQQAFWSCANGRDEQVPGDTVLAVALGGRGDQLHDPGAARPGFLDVIGGFLGPELPARVTPMAFLLIRCSERDPTLSLELAADLPMEPGLIRFDGQGDVGSLLEAPAKNACVVCRASAWISLPSKSIVLSSSLSAARSLDSWVS